MWKLSLIALVPLFAQDLDPELRKFAQAYAAIEANSADPVTPSQAFFGGAIPGALRRLDPHSIFLDPEQFEQLKQMEKSERKGFGSVVSVLPGRVIILQTVAGGPAAKAGLSPGDEILAINGIPLSRLDMDQLIQVLTQARQSTVRLDVRRPGTTRTYQFTLNPELMDSPSVDRAFLLQPGYGYTRIANYDRNTAEQLAAAVDKLGGDALKGLVIDLRNNPGGDAESAVKMAAMFLKPGQRILSIKGRARQGQDIDVPKEAKPYEFPVAILVNAKTASAAEIVTGALQDNRRAQVFGEQSYGKGLVQSVYNLSSNTALALTTAFYYTPSGRSIQRPLEGVQLGSAIGSANFGIHPDQEVYPAAPTRLQAFLDASGALTTFATEYTQKNKVEASFEVQPGLLDDLKVWLISHNVQPSLAEWLQEKPWIANRLKQEIVTLALSVEKGDEVEAQRDPVVQRALASLSR